MVRLMKVCASETCDQAVPATTRPHAIYCSLRCSHNHANREYRRRQPKAPRKPRGTSAWVRFVALCYYHAGWPSTWIADALPVPSDRAVAKWAMRSGVKSGYQRGLITDHGTLAVYRQGCRCDECVAANKARCDAWAQDAKARFAAGVVSPPHGTASTYGNYGCRCEPCRAAQSVKNAEGAKRRRSA